MYNRVYNFSAGPAVMPEPVLERTRDELFNQGQSGMSVLEMSHRSKTFLDLLDYAEHSLREVLNVPKDYAILFLQGGASLQFVMAPLNLYLTGQPIDMLQTGSWTQKASDEIKKVAQVRLAASTEAENFSRVPRLEEIDFNPKASYLHLCSNNTIYGTRWPKFPKHKFIPLIADMSSDLLSRPIDVSNFGLIYAGAQKNIGPAGVTVVIIHKDLAERSKHKTDLPAMLDYRLHIEKGSTYNTPPTFGIYMIGLVLDWLKELGGLTAVEKLNEEKATILYQTIHQSELYHCPVAETDQSRMNVIFRIKGGDINLEQTFVGEASAAGLKNLKGHRAIGGLRASIYNAQPLTGVLALVDFMQAFELRYGAYS